VKVNRYLLGAAVLTTIFAGFLFYAAWPRLVGVEAELRLLPVDPFDPMRGQYLVLHYEINEPPSLPEDVSEGTTLYVVLESGQEGVYNAVSVHLRPPTVTPGRIVIQGVYRQNGRVEYGIENLFIERGARLEERASDLTAYVRILPDGRASVIELRKNGRPVDLKYRAKNVFER